MSVLCKLQHLQSVYNGKNDIWTADWNIWHTILCSCIGKVTDKLQPPYLYWNVQKLYRSKHYVIYTQMHKWVTKNNDFTLYITSWRHSRKYEKCGRWAWCNGQTQPLVGPTLGSSDCSGCWNRTLANVARPGRSSRKNCQAWLAWPVPAWPRKRTQPMNKDRW